MNILVVGNGFDIAHGLPTDYKSFVKFLNIVRLIGDDSCNYQNYVDMIDRYAFCTEIRQFLTDAYGAKDDRVEKLQQLMHSNFWVEYFRPASNLIGTWVGFEVEISEVIQALDSYKRTTDRDERNMLKIQLLTVAKKTGVGIEKFLTSSMNWLLNDLDRLIRCLEIYLCFCLEVIHIEKKLQAVLNIGPIDKVLSFNYTNTFEKVYQPILEKAPEYCYIHGRAKMENTVESNNMVLGIDEYLDEAKRSQEVEFVRFKKFYQRIFKQTDYNYMDWVNKRAGTKNLFIVGHSLATTDKDVLRDLLL